MDVAGGEGDHEQEGGHADERHLIAGLHVVEHAAQEARHDKRCHCAEGDAGHARLRAQRHANADLVRTACDLIGEQFTRHGGAGDPY